MDSKDKFVAELEQVFHVDLNGIRKGQFTLHNELTEALGKRIEKAFQGGEDHFRGEIEMTWEFTEEGKRP